MTLENMTEVYTMSFSDDVNITAFIGDSSNISHANVSEYFDYFVSWEYDLGYGLYKYMCLVILILGISGNILSIVVFSTKSMEKSVSSIFFRALATFDSLLLLTALPRYWVVAVFNYDIRTVHIVICKIHTFLVYWSVDMSGWILSAVALERTIGVTMPHRYKTLVTRNRAKTLIAIISVVMFSINSYILVAQTIVSRINNSPKICVVKRTYHESFEPVWHYLDMTIYCIFPFIIICLSNVCIIYVVGRARYLHRKSMPTNHSSHRTSNMSTILMTVSFVYITCTLPIVVYVPVTRHWWSHGEVTWKQFSQIQLYYSSATLLGTFNSAINFVLYFLSGPSFRKALVGMFIREKNGPAPPP